MKKISLYFFSLLCILFAVQNVSFSQTVWTTRFLNNPGVNELRRLQFVNTLTGFSCGSAGIMLKTTNGGDTWNSINLGTTAYLTSIFFINENTGWVSGDGAFMRKTTNSGASWIPQTLPSSSFTASINFINDQTGFIASHDGIIAKTINGGTNWNTMASTGLLYGEIKFVNSLTGWVLAPGNLSKTTNGGDTWVRKLFSGNLLQDMVFINEQTGWVTDNNMVLKTIDGGTSWSFNPIPISSPMSLKSLDENILWCAGYSGSNGVICRSLNGGVNWTIQSTIPNNLFWGISFPSFDKGWASGNAQISSTSNGTLTSVSSVSTQTPDVYSLKQNYPNPFNPSTSIKFALTKSDFVSLKIYSMNGSEVKSLVNEKMNSGSYEVSFDAAGLTSGTYFYTLQSGEFRETKKMILIK